MLVRYPNSMVSLSSSRISPSDRSYFILGNGSNLLVGDKGYEGVILHLGERFNSITVEGNTITAQAGALLSTVAKTAAKNGLSGMEFAAGIPGTIGGAVEGSMPAHGLIFHYVFL